MRENRLFAYAKTKTQISFAVTAKLISAFVFATRIVQSLYFLKPKFQASIHFLCLYSLVCIGPPRKPRRPVFSERGSYEPPHGISCFIPVQTTVTDHTARSPSLITTLVVCCLVSILPTHPGSMLLTILRWRFLFNMYIWSRCFVVYFIPYSV